MADASTPPGSGVRSGCGTALSDPENGPWTEAQLRSAELVLPGEGPKVPVSIRLDREVIEFFKRQGPGYQSRINAVLRAFVRTQRSG